jgi:hypothetical protein
MTVKLCGMFKSVLVLKKDCCATASALAEFHSSAEFYSSVVDQVLRPMMRCGMRHGCCRAVAGAVRHCWRELLQLTSQQWRADYSGD